MSRAAPPDAASSRVRFSPAGERGEEPQDAMLRPSASATVQRFRISWPSAVALLVLLLGGLVFIVRGVFSVLSLSEKQHSQVIWFLGGSVFLVSECLAGGLGASFLFFKVVPLSIDSMAVAKQRHHWSASAVVWSIFWVGVIVANATITAASFERLVNAGDNRAWFTFNSTATPLPKVCYDHSHDFSGTSGIMAELVWLGGSAAAFFEVLCQGIALMILFRHPNTAVIVFFPTAIVALLFSALDAISLLEDFLGVNMTTLYCLGLQSPTKLFLVRVTIACGVGFRAFSLYWWLYIFAFRDVGSKGRMRWFQPVSFKDREICSDKNHHSLSRDRFFGLGVVCGLISLGVNISVSFTRDDTVPVHYWVTVVGSVLDFLAIFAFSCCLLNNCSSHGNPREPVWSILPLIVVCAGAASLLELSFVVSNQGRSGIGQADIAFLMITSGLQGLLFFMWIGNNNFVLKSRDGQRPSRVHEIAEKIIRLVPGFMMVENVRLPLMLCLHSWFPLNTINMHSARLEFFLGLTVDWHFLCVALWVLCARISTDPSQANVPHGEYTVLLDAGRLN